MKKISILISNKKVKDVHVCSSDFCPVAGIANVSDHSYLEILTPKQMRQILPTVVSQVKAGTTSEKILNEIRYIVHYLHWAKEINKKVYNNIFNSIKL